MIWRSGLGTNTKHNNIATSNNKEQNSHVIVCAVLWRCSLLTTNNNTHSYHFMLDDLEVSIVATAPQKRWTRQSYDGICTDPEIFTGPPASSRTSETMKLAIILVYSTRSGGIPRAELIQHAAISRHARWSGGIMAPPGSQKRWTDSYYSANW